MISFTGTIVIRANPVTAYEDYSLTLTSEQFALTSVQHRKIGGSWSMQFDLVNPDRRQVQQHLNQSVFREVFLYSPDGAPLWRGYINTVTASRGVIEAKASLSNMTNKVWVRYGDPVSRSTAAEDTASQAKYDTIEMVINGGSDISSTVADQVSNKIINQRAYPIPRITKATIGQRAAPPKLTFQCLGWWHAFGHRVYNQTASSGDDDMSNIFDAVNTVCGSHTAGTRIETNVTQLPQETDVDRTAMDFMASMVEAGDSNYDQWVCGVDLDRYLYLRRAELGEVR